MAPWWSRGGERPSPLGRRSGLMKLGAARSWGDAGGGWQAPHRRVVPARPMPMAVATGRSAGSVTPTSGTQQASLPARVNRGWVRVRLATSIARRVLPEPPIPQIVTIRPGCSIDSTVATSLSRPTNRVRYVGSASANSSLSTVTTAPFPPSWAGGMAGTCDAERPDCALRAYRSPARRRQANGTNGPTRRLSPRSAFRTWT